MPKRYIKLPFDTIKNELFIPEGAQIVAIYSVPEEKYARIVVEHLDFTPVERGCATPELEVDWVEPTKVYVNEPKKVSPTGLFDF